MFLPQCSHRHFPTSHLLTPSADVVRSSQDAQETAENPWLTLEPLRPSSQGVRTPIQFFLARKSRGILVAVARSSARKSRSSYSPDFASSSLLLTNGSATSLANYSS